MLLHGAGGRGEKLYTFHIIGLVLIVARMVGVLHSN